MPARQFSLENIFGAIFWIAGGLALWRLTSIPELNDRAQFVVACTCGAWVGVAAGQYAGFPGRAALLGLAIAAVCKLLALGGMR
jgi:hypothetical protein